jgi:hypothetical protein
MNAYSAVQSPAPFAMYFQSWDPHIQSRHFCASVVYPRSIAIIDRPVLLHLSLGWTNTFNYS